MDLRKEVNEMRYEWGTCAVCGENAPNWNAAAISKEYQYVFAPDVDQPQMLCSKHRQQYRKRQARNFKHWVENHQDSHLFYHVLGVKCPDCVLCSGCDERLPMQGDYFCYECRYPE